MANKSYLIFGKILIIFLRDEGERDRGDRRRGEDASRRRGERALNLVIR